MTGARSATVLTEYRDSMDDVPRPVLVHRFPAGWRGISTGLVGGGIGPVGWWLNAMVNLRYFHPDPVQDALGIAAQLRLDGAGVAMLTAADTTRFTVAHDDGVDAVATVGLGLPVPAAAPAEVLAMEHYAPGTINVLVCVPVPLQDAALVNAVLTATEAKTQALIEAGVPGTGTSSDAVCIACPIAQPDGPQPEPYGGPRSLWGARLARAVHQAVAEGTRDWMTRHPPGDPHRRWPNRS